MALRPGQPLTYTLSYKNDGVAIASGVLLTDTLPAALSSLSVTSSGPAISTLPARHIAGRSPTLRPAQAAQSRSPAWSILA